MLDPPSQPEDPRVFSGVMTLLNKASYALQHVQDAQEVTRVLSTATSDPAALPWPTVLDKITSASGFLESVQASLDSSLAEAAVAVCPTRLCADPSVRTCSACGGGVAAAPSLCVVARACVWGG